MQQLRDGAKTIIARGAAGRRFPHSRVFPRETLYFVENDGNQQIRAKARVKSVFNSEKMTEEESIALIEKNKKALNLSDAQTTRWAGKKFLRLIEG